MNEWLLLLLTKAASSASHLYRVHHKWNETLHRGWYHPIQLILKLIDLKHNNAY